MLHALKIATGRGQTSIVCDLLNWRALPGKNSKWSPPTLRRWAAISLRSVRRVFIRAMPNDFEHFLSEEIARRPDVNLRVVMDPVAADAILAVHPWCMLRSIVANPPMVVLPVLTPDSRFTLSVSLLDTSETVVLWPAGKENSLVSFLATPARAEEAIRDLGGPRDAAGGLVADLAKALQETRAKVARTDAPYRY